MAINAEVSGEQPKKVEWDFPCLGVSESGQIVLFYADKCGVNVNDVNNPIGEHCTVWIMELFTPLSPDVTVKLSNKKP